ncbi:MAG: hypothetical protein QOD09_2652 [Bradyrhizobium sp.]|jgi:hypothetical protein|nr:hypothetical protein [Bradyrhizobium sp.]
MPFQYATKVVCGLSKDSGRLAHGIYETLVNIHSPNKEAMPFRYKLALAAEMTDGTISPFRDGKIGPDGAQFFGCADLHKIFGVPATTFIDGFFVIESKQPLDVVAVYTTNDLDGKGVPAIEVERTFERVI